MKHILIAGGDKRNVYLANSLNSEGFTVKVIGFDKSVCFDKGIERITDAKVCAPGCVLAIFGIPASFDGIRLWTPMSFKEIYLSDITGNLPSDCILAGGRVNLCPQSFEGFDVTDYTTRCDFAYLNAVPTAEGAIEAVMKDSEKTLADSVCAVTGFGRCSEILAQRLGAFGTEVHIYARSPKDLSHARACGFVCHHLDDLEEKVGMYDIIFNSVPFGIFKKEHTEKMKRSCIFADIASAPGGLDKNAPKEKINYKFLPGLPGTYSPYSAAEIIKTVIMTLIKEKGKDARQWLMKE